VIVIVVVTSPVPRGPEWVDQRGPTGPINLDSLVANDSGFALLSGVTDEGVLLWWSTDGADWAPHPLPGAPSRLASAGELLIAYDGMEAATLEFQDGSWELGEEITFPDEMRLGQSPGRPGLVSGPAGFLMTSVVGDVWWWDLDDSLPVVTNPAWGPGETVEVPFDSSCQPPTRISPDVPPMTAAAEAGFLALVSSNPDEPFGMWPVCEPTTWVSLDGRRWSSTTELLDDGAYIYSVAHRDGRFVAVGGHGIGEADVWFSEGAEWAPADSFDPGPGVDLYAVESGPGGWVILGQETETSTPVGWVSPDGTCWTALTTEVDGDRAAVAAGQILLIDRVTFPETWVTDVTDGWRC
jgi:hypothetical protein